MEESLSNEPNLLVFAKESLKLKSIDICSYSPLALAYMGDVVYEFIIRTKIINEGSIQVNKMHKKSAGLVKASTQAQLIKLLEEELTEEELSAYKRGRNAKSSSTAKNATMIDYRMATGFEALVGYLYLTEQYERLITLIRDGLSKIGELNL